KTSTPKTSPAIASPLPVRKFIRCSLSAKKTHRRHLMRQRNRRGNPGLLACAAGRYRARTTMQRKRSRERWRGRDARRGGREGCLDRLPQLADVEWLGQDTHEAIRRGAVLSQAEGISGHQDQR